MTLWKRFRYRLEIAGLRLASWIIPRLSRQSCRHLAHAIGELAARLDRKGRATALENIRCALGPDLSPAKRDEILRASYRNFARTMLDLLWAPNLTQPEHKHWLRRVVWPGYEKLLNERGAVFLSLHYGSWEYSSLTCALSGYPCIAVAEHFKNEALAEFITRPRQSSGQTIISQENSMLKMIRAVKRGGYTALLTDLTLRPGQISTVIRAFGMEMCVSVLHAVLAQRANAVLVPILTEPDADGGYTAHMMAPIEWPADATLQQIAQICWDYFEPYVLRNPGLWMWPYKHFRYRPREAQRDYPAYANVSGAFEKLRTRELGS